MNSLAKSLISVVALGLLAQLATAQQGVQLSGIIDSPEPLAEGTRVAVHIVDPDGVWGDEVATATPVAGPSASTWSPSRISSSGRSAPVRSCCPACRTSTG